MAYPFTPPGKQREMAQDVLADREVAGLAQQIEQSTWRNYQEILSLQGRQKMPVDLRREYGRFLARWKKFVNSRKGKYTGQDYLVLKNFGDENQRFSVKIATVGTTSAKAPLVEPASPDSEVRGMRVVKHAAIGVVGALLLAGIYKHRKFS